MSWMSMLAKRNKSIRKKAKNNNLLKTKIILNIKMSIKRGPVFTLSLPEGAARPPTLPSVTPLVRIVWVIVYLS